MEFLFKFYDFFSTFLLEIWNYEFGAVLVEVTLWLYVPNTISVKKNSSNQTIEKQISDSACFFK